MFLSLDGFLSFPERRVFLSEGKNGEFAREKTTLPTGKKGVEHFVGRRRFRHEEGCRRTARTFGLVFIQPGLILILCDIGEN